MHNGSGTIAPAHGARRLRAVLFIDYENARNAARELFEQQDGESTTSSRRRGDFHPRRLGEKLCNQYNRRPECQSEESKIELVEVRVYRGKPDPSKDQRGQLALWADEEQIKVWRDPSEGQTGCPVSVITFLMQYPESRYSVPRERDNRVEKEVDAAIAMDLISITDAECDVAILWSEDTDLRPAVCEFLERAARGEDKPELHLAGWRKKILNLGRCKSRSKRHSRPHRHRVSFEMYEKVKDETDYFAKAKERTANYLTGRYDDGKSFACRLMRYWYDRRQDNEDEAKVAGVYVQILEIGTQYPVYFERLIDGESVREDFETHKGADRSFVVKEILGTTDDQDNRPAFFILREVPEVALEHRPRANQNAQSTNTREVLDSQGEKHKRSRAYKHGEFVPAKVTRVLSDTVYVRTIYGDDGEVEDRDLVPEEKPSDVVTEGDILPLVVRLPQLGRRLGLKLVEKGSPERQQAEESGWEFNTAGRLAVPPAHVAEQFQDRPD